MIFYNFTISTYNLTMNRLIRPVVTLLLTLTALLSVYELVKVLIWAFDTLLLGKKYLRHILLWFLSGGLAYYVVFGLVWRKYRGLIHTTIHEWLHALMCMLMFRDVVSVQSTASDGGVMYHRGGANIFIALAPYTLPILTYVALMIASLMPASVKWFYSMVGFTFFLHMHAFMLQTRLEQPDLQESGLYRSLVFIATFLPMNIAICLYSLGANLWKGIGMYFASVWGDVSGLVVNLFV